MQIYLHEEQALLGRKRRKRGQNYFPHHSVSTLGNILPVIVREAENDGHENFDDS
jgi:hypothetical protein